MNGALLIAQMLYYVHTVHVIVILSYIILLLHERIQHHWYVHTYSNNTFIFFYKASVMCVCIYNKVFVNNNTSFATFSLRHPLHHHNFLQLGGILRWTA